VTVSPFTAGAVYLGKKAKRRSHGSLSSARRSEGTVEGIRKSFWNADKGGSPAGAALTQAEFEQEIGRWKMRLKFWSKDVHQTVDKIHAREPLTGCRCRKKPQELTVG